MGRSLGSNRYYDDVAQPITQNWEGQGFDQVGATGDNQDFFTFDGAKSGTVLDVDSTAKELVITQGAQYTLKPVAADVYVEITAPPPAGQTATVTAATTTSFPLTADTEYVYMFSEGQKLSLIAAADNVVLHFIPSVI